LPRVPDHHRHRKISGGATGTSGTGRIRAGMVTVIIPTEPAHDEDDDSNPDHPVRFWVRLRRHGWQRAGGCFRLIHTGLSFSFSNYFHLYPVKDAPRRAANAASGGARRMLSEWFHTTPQINTLDLPITRRPEIEVHIVRLLIGPAFTAQIRYKFELLLLPPEGI